MMIGVRRSKSPCWHAEEAAPPQANFPESCKQLVGGVLCGLCVVESCMRVLWVCCGKPATAQRCVGEWMTKMDGLNAAMHE
jgi:hypothetical protein